MVRVCVLGCNEKRDFMDHEPPKSEADFYADYDPMVGLGTAAVLLLFFFVITIQSFLRWATRKVQFIKFENDRKRAMEALQSSSAHDDVIDV